MKKILGKAMVLLFALSIILSPLKANAQVNIDQGVLQNAANSFVNYVKSVYDEDTSSPYAIGNLKSATVDSQKIYFNFANNKTVEVWYFTNNNQGTISLLTTKFVANNLTQEGYDEIEDYLFSGIVYGYELVSTSQGGSYDKSIPYFVNSYTLAYEKNPENPDEYDADWQLKDNLNSDMLGSYRIYKQYKTKDDNAAIPENGVQVDQCIDIYLNANFAGIAKASDAVEEAVKRENNNGENNQDDKLNNLAGDVNDASKGENTGDGASATDKKEEENPKTGFALPVTILLVGISLVVIISIVTKKKRKFLKI